jgi:hypothetical protein
MSGGPFDSLTREVSKSPIKNVKEKHEVIGALTVAYSNFILRPTATFLEK